MNDYPTPKRRDAGAKGRENATKPEMSECVQCGRLAQSRVSYKPDVLVCGQECLGVWQRETLQRLFIEHVDYTYLVTLGMLRFNDEGANEPHLARLLKNQEEIGAVIEGDSDSRLEALLKDHILIAGNILGKVRRGRDIKDEVRRWKENGEQVTARLHVLLPRIPVGYLDTTFQEHLAQTLKYATAVANGDITRALQLLDAARTTMAQLALRLGSELKAV